MIDDVERECSLCGEPTFDASRSGRCETCAAVKVRPAVADAVVHPTLEFERDHAARAFVVHHREGATLDEVGTAFGLTRERIRQIQQSALVKIRRVCEREGIDVADFVHALANRREEQAHPSVHEDRLVRVVERDPESAQAPNDPKSNPQSPEAIRVATLLDELDRRSARVGALFSALPPPLTDEQLDADPDPDVAIARPFPLDEQLDEPPAAPEVIQLAATDRAHLPAVAGVLPDQLPNARASRRALRYAKSVPLFDALCALRDAHDVRDPSLAGAWRIVDDAVRERVQANAHGFVELVEDAHQVAMIEVAASVHRLRATRPNEASGWLFELCRARTLDAIRTEHRHQLRRDVQVELDGLSGEVPIATIPPDVDLLWSVLLPHIEALARAEPDPARRMRTSAATFLRVVDELEADEIAQRIAPEASREVLYKWVERGRPMLLAAIARWRVAARGDIERSVAAQLAELVGVRRADAGVERPARRRTANAAPASMRACA